MTIDELHQHLTRLGLNARTVPQFRDRLYVESSREIPDAVYAIRGWSVAECGIGAFFIFRNR